MIVKNQTAFIHLQERETQSCRLRDIGQRQIHFGADGGNRPAVLFRGIRSEQNLKNPVAKRGRERIAIESSTSRQDQSPAPSWLEISRANKICSSTYEKAGLSHHSWFSESDVAKVVDKMWCSLDHGL